MKKITYIIAGLIISISVQAQIDRSVRPLPGPAPKINLQKPQTFKLANGLTVMVVEDHKLPRVTFSLSMDNPPSLEGDIKGVETLVSSMMGNGTSKISKDDFNEQIDYYGASIGFGLGRVNGSTLSRFFPEILSLTAQGALDPLFTQEELDSERAKLLDGLKTEEKDVLTIARRVNNVLLYGKKHPSGEYLSEETINRVTLSDVKAVYKKYFVPGNAYLVIVGDVKFADVKKLVTANFASWGKAVAPKSVYNEPVNLTKTEIDFVDVPNAAQTEIYVGNIIDLKMTSPDYFAALVANQILGGGAEARLFKNLREAHGWTYGSYSSLRGSKYISNFTAKAQVRSEVADSSVVELLNELQRIRETLPTEDDLALAKAKYTGSFVMSAQNPTTIASFALAIKTQHLPENFYENYIQNINDVTLEQVRAAAQKYILHSGARIVIVGKASETLDNLKKLNIPINYFDKYGTPAEEPVQQQIDANVTPASILEKYIAATGGKEAWSAVKTLQFQMNGKAMGGEMVMKMKSTADGKFCMETSVMGMSTKMVFNGQTGYTLVMGHKTELGEKEISDMKSSAAPCSELKMLDEDVQLKGVEDGAYVLQMGNRFYYYDVQTGLKVAEATIANVNGQETQKTLFGDYQEIKGVKIPCKYTVNVGMEVELTLSDVKINEGVSDADFE
ncbi:MAG: insulinase family protein [Prevotella sp.]|jgi:predicted Zn-dependent peptidase|nr:insulinase family protein [Prevotella sp.]